MMYSHKRTHTQTCVYIYTTKPLYIYMPVTSYTHARTHTHTHIYMSVYIYIYIYIYLCVHVHVCVRVFVCVCIHIYTIIYMPTHAHKHTHAYLYILSCTRCMDPKDNQCIHIHVYTYFLMWISCGGRHTLQHSATHCNTLSKEPKQMHAGKNSIRTFKHTKTRTHHTIDVTCTHVMTQIRSSWLISDTTALCTQISGGMVVYLYPTLIFICVYIYIYIHTYVCMYVCIYTYINICVLYVRVMGLSVPSGGKGSSLKRKCH